MEFRYKNKSQRNNYENDRWLSKKFDDNIVSKFKNFRGVIIDANNIEHAKKICPSFRIKKLVNTNKWSAKLSHKYRVNFYVDEDGVEIELISVNAHKEQ